VENGRKNGENFHIISGYSLSPGNIIGGVFFVALIRLIHVRGKPGTIGMNH
jgi:formate/nitrite transporter FocA (FNT family)